MDVVALLNEGADVAYSVFRDLALTALPAGEGGRELVERLCAALQVTIEVCHVSMHELPSYTGLVRREGPRHWMIYVRDDVTAGQADLIIAHEVSHILRDDIPISGLARPRVIPVTPSEIVAKSFSITMARLFAYGDPEGTREAALARLPQTYSALVRALPGRMI